MNILLSVAVPPLTKRPSDSPTCCVPGSVFNAPTTSAFAPAVVTMSREERTVVFFWSLASKAPAVIVTAFNSVINSFTDMFKLIGSLSIVIFFSYEA